ncbi:hypothetical protein GCM10009838_78330 [Catenulispora subtropica]|uniref:Uncharacterized protein n=1 Tax=Catenulispora subtropica TaxID=450798 RepID=A0ABP5ENH6_9ACTN
MEPDGGAVTGQFGDLGGGPCVHADDPIGVGLDSARDGVAEDGAGPPPGATVPWAWFVPMARAPQPTVPRPHTVCNGRYPHRLQNGPDSGFAAV